jgi:hypothetical protein
MRRRCRSYLLLLLALPGAACRGAAENTTFFITSVPAGDGGSFGGLAGADAHCQRLAEAAGAGGREWRAYLSAAADDGVAAVNARDRIGRGPWHNARGVLIASSLDDLHGPNNQINLNTARHENGASARGAHDILTGSNPDGTLADGDATCRNWTSTTGKAMVGHSDKHGPGPTGTSWNSAHLSDGCSPEELQQSNGVGRFYCFAAK